MTSTSLATALTQPVRLWRRAEILTRNCPVPRASGIYAWYFRSLPGTVPADGCVRFDDATLLYIGISPKRPSVSGGRASRQSLRHRIRYHLRGNAEGSTLRLTLGCLLSRKLGIRLQRVGSGSRRTFADGESRLSQWMDDNALVVWLPHAEPWILESQLIANVSLPLNLQGNQHHAFHGALSAIRRTAKEQADQLPIWRG